jgi:hypothetical protein
MTVDAAVSTEPGETPAPQFYRFSALFSGLAKMWRAWRVTGPVILVNAVVQALLIIPSTGGTFSTSVFLLTALASAVVMLGAAAVVVAGGLESAVGRVTWGATLQRIRAALLPFTLWTIGLFVVVLVGLSLHTWPGLVLAAVLPFVMIAAMAPDRNPIGANFRVIAARPFRWAVTLLIIGGIAALIWLGFALLWFFVPGVIGAVIASLVGGLLTWWWCTSLSCIYLSVRHR